MLTVHIDHATDPKVAARRIVSATLTSVARNPNESDARRQMASAELWDRHGHIFRQIGEKITATFQAIGQAVMPAIAGLSKALQQAMEAEEAQRAAAEYNTWERRVADTFEVPPDRVASWASTLSTPLADTQDWADRIKEDHHGT